MSFESREDCVYLAKLAEQAERYEGMWSQHLVTRSSFINIGQQKWLNT